MRTTEIQGNEEKFKAEYGISSGNSIEMITYAFLEMCGE